MSERVSRVVVRDPEPEPPVVVDGPWYIRDSEDWFDTDDLRGASVRRHTLVGRHVEIVASESRDASKRRTQRKAVLVHPHRATPGLA